MKGILLAGGSGSRLRPLTLGVNKHLLPIHDRPMIHHPLALLMLAGIRQVALISNPGDLPAFEKLLGNGADLGLEISYLAQPRPAGIAEAYGLAASFLAAEPSVLILGDNLFWGEGTVKLLPQAIADPRGATLFCRRHTRPEHFAVLDCDASGQPLRIEEKPKQPQSPWVVTGLYVCDGQAPSLASTIKPSARGELEITDLLDLYLAEGSLRWRALPSEDFWCDAGTWEGWHEANAQVAALQHQQGLIACPEQIAYRAGWIDKQALLQQAQLMANSDHARHLLSLAQQF